MIHPFSISRVPAIEFGKGAFTKVPSLIQGFGKRVLLVTGKSSFRNSPHWAPFLDSLKKSGIDCKDMAVVSEPSPDLVDDAAREFRSYKPDCIVAVGGGSALDAGKAIAGLIHVNNSVMDFLEGVGPELPYPGPSVPFIAVPTTAGTGSEATKNAVLSKPGADGFKKSFRHETLVPRYAVIDPELIAGCPPELIAANGMDAFTQLLESYVSLKANPFTDALALSGMEIVRDSLLAWHQEPDNAELAGKMGYAALLSGITLAQCGLGSVHGMAPPLGAFFGIPHGVACGTLVAAATEVNIQVMQSREPENPALKKYAIIGKRMTNNSHLKPEDSLKMLVRLLYSWTETLNLPRLSALGISRDDFGKIARNSRGSSMKTNPVLLEDSDIDMILSARY